MTEPKGFQFSNSGPDFKNFFLCDYFSQWLNKQITNPSVFAIVPNILLLMRVLSKIMDKHAQFYEDKYVSSRTQFYYGINLTTLLSYVKHKVKHKVKTCILCNPF